MHTLQPLADFFTSFSKAVVILDLETTGGNITNDRITEIAFLRFENGKCESYSQLINPQIEIPEFVASLTGISNDMVTQSPTFAEVAPQILPLLRGSIIIAHNSRFDYNFLCREMLQAGLDFGTTALCSVQLSRKLYPEFYKHSLDSIAERHQLTQENRHRAMSDVVLLAQYLQLALQERGANAWREHAQTLFNPKKLPENLPQSLAQSIYSLPDAHGVVVWYNAANEAIQITAHNQAYREIAEILNRKNTLKSAVKIQWHPAIGSLHTLLLQAQLSHDLNFRCDENTARHTIQVYTNEQGCLKVRPKVLNAGFYDQPPHGIFANAKASKHALSEWAKAHHLCPTLLNILPYQIPKDAPCPVSLTGNCSTACQQNDIEAHNIASQNALPFLPVLDWKQASCMITESNPHTQKSIQISCSNGAIQLPNGKWFVSSDTIAQVKQKFRHAAHEISPWTQAE